MIEHITSIEKSLKLKNINFNENTCYFYVNNDNEYEIKIFDKEKLPNSVKAYDGGLLINFLPNKIKFHNTAKRYSDIYFMKIKRSPTNYYLISYGNSGIETVSKNFSDACADMISILKERGYI